MKEIIKKNKEKYSKINNITDLNESMYDLVNDYGYDFSLPKKDINFNVIALKSKNKINYNYLDQFK